MKKSFGTVPGGFEASLYTITGGGITAAVSDFGATLVSLWVPDREGKPTDVALGFDRAAQYLEDTGCIGATVGRNANRCGNAQLLLNGKVIQLQKNEGENNLHSGPDFWYHRPWEVAAQSEDAITFSLLSPDGDQGFPGELRFRVTYRVREGALHIVYEGQCDTDTILNPTNHAYFDLSGRFTPESAMAQELTIHAETVTVADKASIPTGENRPVAGTPMDFRTPKAIGRDIAADYDCLHNQGGYDHNFNLSGPGPQAALYSRLSGIRMEVITDRPGIQFYAGNFLIGSTGKYGAVYVPRSGVALETQLPPDCTRHPGWPSSVLKAGTPFQSETVYRFTAEK